MEKREIFFLKVHYKNYYCFIGEGSLCAVAVTKLEFLEHPK